MSSKRTTKAPQGLQKWGNNLWKCTMTGARAKQHDLELLETACRLNDRIHACRATLATDGLVSRGRYGQLIQHPLIEVERTAMAEFRQCLKMLGLHEQASTGVGR
jgi:P27 family predicted phage terminase small subunit